MALDLGPYDIRVNALMPGSIDTAGLSLDQRKLRGENVPLGRIGEPFDMTVIKIDGGMLAQQRSATVDIKPPKDFPQLEDL